MAVAYTTQNRALTVSLSGELDHHRVKGVIRELEGEIDRLLPQQLVVDCAGVTFMDSAGIAILLRLWQRMEELGGSHPHPGPAGAARDRVFRAAGLARLIPTEPIPERSDA